MDLKMVNFLFYKKNSIKDLLHEKKSSFVVNIILIWLQKRIVDQMVVFPENEDKFIQKLSFSFDGDLLEK
jgi:hypothetical protein